MIYNASVIFWKYARAFLKPNFKRYLCPILDKLTGSLRTANDSDYEWRAFLERTFVECLLDASAAAPPDALATLPPAAASITSSSSSISGIKAAAAGAGGAGAAKRKSDPRQIAAELTTFIQSQLPTQFAEHFDFMVRHASLDSDPVNKFNYEYFHQLIKASKRLDWRERSQRDVGPQLGPGRHQTPHTSQKEQRVKYFLSCICECIWLCYNRLTKCVLFY